MFHRLSVSLLFFFLVLGAGPAFAELDQKEMKKLLNELDDRARSVGDYKALLYLEQKQKGKSDLVYQAVTYRREDEEKFAFLFLKPKAEAGKGYVKLEKNLFIYDPSVGKWERRTERTRIGGTDSRRQDFDLKNLAKNYTPEYVGAGKLGKHEVHHLRLTAKTDAPVPFPIMDVWLDQKTNNLLKQQDFASSGKLLRTVYFPKWEKVHSKAKDGDVYFPREIRIYDELQKGNQTNIVVQGVEIDELPDNIFTKAWLESKSR